MINFPYVVIVLKTAHPTEKPHAYTIYHHRRHHRQDLLRRLSQFEVGESQVQHILTEGLVDFDYDVVPLLQKDSLEITDEDRSICVIILTPTMRRTTSLPTVRIRCRKQQKR